MKLRSINEITSVFVQSGAIILLKVAFPTNLTDNETNEAIMDQL
jgi:hypothetical protein